MEITTPPCDHIPRGGVALLCPHARRPPRSAASFMTALTTGYAALGLTRPSDDLRCYRRPHHTLDTSALGEAPRREVSVPLNSIPVVFEGLLRHLVQAFRCLNSPNPSGTALIVALI